MERAAKHPKKFFAYSMIFLSVSFVGSLIQGFSSRLIHCSKSNLLLYNKSAVHQNSDVKRDKEMENIVEELKGLKLKRDRNELRKEDSLRIEYLYSQYQKLKNSKYRKQLIKNSNSMKKINFKDKKYVLPLLALPFLLLFIYVGAQFHQGRHQKDQPKELSTSFGETQDSIMTKNDAYDAFFKKATTDRC
jgi:hypothetical protein